MGPFDQRTQQDDQPPLYPPALGGNAVPKPDVFTMAQGKPQPVPSGPVSPLDKQEQDLEQRRETAAWKLANPWGTANNHPGTMGKIAHVLSVAGNIAGDIFAPAVTSRIPGSQLNLQGQEAQAGKGVQTIEAEKSKEGLEGAQAGNQTAEAGKAKEDTELAPGKAASEEGLQGAQAGNLNSEAESRLLLVGHAHAVQTALRNNVDPNTDPTVQAYTDAIQAIQKQPTPKGMEKVDLVGPDGKPIAANYDPAKGLYTDASGKVIENPRPYEKPNQAGMVTMIAPDPNTPGGGIVERLGAGAHVAPGSQTAAGINSMNTPTSQSRNMAEMAKTVLPQMTAVSQEVDQMAQSLGPAVGRWNQLMVNKGGTDFPQFAKLDTDLDLLASAIVRTHFGARGGQGYREELKKQFGEAQSPEDLKARIAGANNWLEGYAHMADRGGEPPPAETRTFNGANYEKGADGQWHKQQP